MGCIIKQSTTNYSCWYISIDWILVVNIISSTAEKMSDVDKDVDKRFNGYDLTIQGSSTGMYVVNWILRFTVWFKIKYFMLIMWIMWTARQFYEDHKAMFDDDEDVQPMVLAFQFITSRDEIEMSKAVREFRYALASRSMFVKYIYCQNLNDMKKMPSIFTLPYCCKVWCVLYWWSICFCLQAWLKYWTFTELNWW